MTGKIQDFATIGIVHPMIFKPLIRGEGDFGPSIAQILNDPYFGGIEAGWVKDPAERAKVAQLIKKSGKAMSFAGQPVLLTQKLDLNHLDEAERKRAVDALIGVIPQAVEFGARGFGVLSGKVVAPEHKSRAMEQLIKSLTEVGGELKKHGIRLVLETFDQLSYGKNALIGPHKDAAVIAKEVRKVLPNFGLMMDLSHLPLQGETAQEAWDTAGEYVVHAHIGNCVMDNPSHPMNGDEHPPFCDPAGKVCMDELVEYLRVLKKGGYLSQERKPFLSFEVCIYADWTQEKLIKHSQETLDAAWAKV